MIIVGATGGRPSCMDEFRIAVGCGDPAGRGGTASVERIPRVPRDGSRLSPHLTELDSGFRRNDVGAGLVPAQTGATTRVALTTII
jgi:hypothetical protein